MPSRPKPRKDTRLAGLEAAARVVTIYPMEDHTSDKVPCKICEALLRARDRVMVLIRAERRRKGGR